MTTTTTARRTLDVEAVRRDFPILSERIGGRPLVYLDNAATTQKPEAVIEAVARFYRTSNANVHRGVHALGQRATDAFEDARRAVQRLLGAAQAEEIVFVRGATEAINLVANAWAAPRLGPDDEVLVTHLEHHSNLVPWQLLCRRTGARLRVAPVDDAGELVLPELERLLGPRTRVVAVGHVSNALGTVNPVARIAALARRRSPEAVVVVDGAQAVPHGRVDVRALDADFYAFSGHKAYGPTGIGALYGRAELLRAMEPWQAGGEMIRAVRLEGTVFADPPARFEAGTPDVSGAVGLAAAIEYLEALGLDAVAAHERDLLQHATARLREVPGVRLVGTAAEKAAVLSFVVEGAHPHDVGTVLDHGGVAVRAGHHCAQPLMERLGLVATVRASFGLYNTRAEADVLVDGVRRAAELLTR